MDFVSITGKLCLYGLSVLFTAIVYLTVTSLYNVLLHPLRKHPGPKLFAMTAAPIYFHRMTGGGARTVSALHEKYGHVVRLAPNELSYTDPQAWKEIYRPSMPGKPEFSKDLTVLGPNPPGVQGILRGDLANHARQRRMFSAAFSERAIKEQEPMLQGYVRELLNRLGRIAAVQKEHGAAKDSQADMVKSYNLTTFDIMGEFIFGEPLNLLRDGEYIPWMEAIFGNLQSLSISQVLRRFGLLDIFLALIAPKSAIEMRKRHHQFVVDKVDRRMAMAAAGKTHKPDLWTHVEKYEGEERVSRGEMYANANTFMIAGTETTSTLMSGLTWLLCSNPEKMRVLCAEIRALDREQLNFAHLQGLDYLNACLKEGLRIYPSVPTITQRLVPQGGAMVCGQYVPQGTTVGVHHLATYHSTQNFYNPHEFHPERWLLDCDAIYAADNRAALQPFSFGPRNCIGMGFAYHEMRLVLASVLWNFDMDLLDPGDNWLDQNTYDLWDKKPLYVQLRSVVR